ncbi:MAG: DNA cytosine methyltransferase, partial [Actinobacteria bacterium]|nr:DNA cytosine methyltransferase [Actinomycetota bacterium]
IDIHKPSMETFLHNHPRTMGILGDIRKIPDDLVVDLLSGIEVKVLMAGVPCQGFSLNNRKRNPNDPRNYLFWEFIRFVKLLKPDFLVLENVSGMKSTANGSFVVEIEKQIKIAGEKIGKRYRVEHRILNAADYGVPQIRKRLIFLASAEGYPIVWPEPEFGTPERPYRTVFDAIGDLPPLKPGEKKSFYTTPPQTEYQKLMRNGSIVLLNHEAPKHPQSTVERIKRTKPGEPMYPRFTQRIRLSWDKLSPTQVAGGIRPQFQFGHPRDPRGLTVRERARIQSFPDWYQFFGGVVQGRVQTGNAVPPLLAKAIAERIKEVIRRYG